eukprot:3890436-Amphidinium_carterae.1
MTSLPVHNDYVVRGKPRDAEAVFTIVAVSQRAKVLKFACCLAHEPAKILKWSGIACTQLRVHGGAISALRVKL